MSANPTVKCPSCNQDNAQDMAFCIFCGANMKQKSPTRAEQSIPADEPAETQLRICPKCQSADPLNQEYCIICGTKIPKRERVRGVTSSVMVQSELLSLKDEISTIQAVRTQQNAKPLRLPTSLMFFGIACVGIGLGIFAGLFAHQQHQTEPVPIALPKAGLAVLAAQPYCDVLLESSDRRDFYIGKTSQAGDLAMENLLPGTYKLEVKGPQGEIESRSRAVVSQGEPYILGGPPGPRVFAAGSGAQQ